VKLTFDPFSPLDHMVVEKELEYVAGNDLFRS